MVVDLLHRLLVPPELVQEILSVTECETNKGCVVKPTTAILLSLEPLTKKLLYRRLARMPGNDEKRTPLRLRSLEVERLLGSDGLSLYGRELFNKLVVHQDEFHILWDSEALCQLLPDEDKVRFLKIVSPVDTYLVKLVMRPDTDIEPIYRYWADRPRTKSLRSLLEGAKPKPGEKPIYLDIVHLFSPFLRGLAYTYPDPDDPPRNCHWTTFNFYEDQPSDRFLDPREAQAEHLARFERIRAEEARYGDMVAVLDGEGYVVHTAIYLVDDLVFTKNGKAIFAPWMVATFDELRVLYMDMPGSYIAFYRRKPVGAR